jgi:sensor histidine kinase YesM
MLLKAGFIYLAFSMMPKNGRTDRLSKNYMLNQARLLTETFKCMTSSFIIKKRCFISAWGLYNICFGLIEIFADFYVSTNPMIEIIDNTNEIKSAGKMTDRRAFIYICLLLVLPVYWAAIYYIEAAIQSEEEVLSVVATIIFFLFFYTGWYVAGAWFNFSEKLTNQILKGIVLSILAVFIWLIAHGDFQLRHMHVINLALFWVPYMMLSACIGMLIRLIRMSAQRKLQRAQAVAAQSQSELHLLQSQLSPHFLFNTLNNMYGLSITEHEKIPQLLLKLSDLLRYSVYEAKELMVPLKSEMDYINNYIDFEKIRIGDRLELHYDMEAISTDQIRIAPMLLIVFIENAFKHSKDTADEKIFVDISLKLWSGMILFSVNNSYDSSMKSVANASSGFGLANAKKRLLALYPNQHSLKMEGKDNFYSVSLQLKAK